MIYGFAVFWGIVEWCEALFFKEAKCKNIGFTRYVWHLTLFVFCSMQPREIWRNPCGPFPLSFGRTFPQFQIEILLDFWIVPDSGGHATSRGEKMKNMEKFSVALNLTHYCPKHQQMKKIITKAADFNIKSKVSIF